ncbi:MAG: TraR/DksA family transcriptional regulator [Bacteroidetes bacterium HGW-Bacteroidetes-2]|jgi:DnaK suppressor protein|nr:MAG: TraR/DksA family transcriptional regulator [Bacteroidetes bacterium HGW-Bacteroidetes-8]PKP26701.1 MAG: TraR/DksA family transcriptional regulator [Bacteroidetes bacterium HGW-Bacteroidetes-2]
MIDKLAFTEKVFEEIHKLENAVKLYEGMTQAVAPDDAIGRVSRMDAINNKSVNDAALFEAKKRLQQLSYVLDRLNDSDFGICVKCKKPIPEGRLLIRPESRLCVQCAR